MRKSGRRWKKYKIFREKERGDEVVWEENKLTYTNIEKEAMRKSERRRKIHTKY